MFTRLQSPNIEVLMAMVMKNGIFWDITPCRPVKVNHVSDKAAFACYLLNADFLRGLLFNTEELHSVIRGRVSKEVTNGSKTAVMHVIGFLCASLGSSTVQLHDSLGSRRACAC
jgi:hypothetical protein